PLPFRRWTAPDLSAAARISPVLGQRNHNREMQSSSAASDQNENLGRSRASRRDPAIDNRYAGALKPRLKCVGHVSAHWLRDPAGKAFGRYAIAWSRLGEVNGLAVGITARRFSVHLVPGARHDAPLLGLGNSNFWFRPNI